MVREQAGLSGTALIAVIAGLGVVAAISIVISRADPADTDNPIVAPVAETTLRQTEPVPDFDPNTAANILQAIRSLESDRDPKCHSTACRFENFIYGTPLSDAARDRKVDLQKELVLRLWRVATSAAADAGDRTLSRRRLQPF